MTPRWLHWPSTASWSPSDLADLRAWYKADAITGLSDGDPVSTWSDSSGGGYDLTQTSTARPLYQTNTLNGLPVVEFDGTDDFLSASTAADWKFLHDSTGSTVCAVWKAGVVSNPDTAHQLMGTRSNPNQNGFLIFYDDRSTVPRNDQIWVAAASGSAWAFINASADDAHDANVAKLLSAVNDTGNATAANRSSLRVDGGNAITNNTNTATPNTGNPEHALYMGAGQNGKLNGYIAEVVICNAVISSTDREKLEGYLAHKWGLESNLPSTHPYKASAP